MRIEDPFSFMTSHSFESFKREEEKGRENGRMPNLLFSTVRSFSSLLFLDETIGNESKRKRSRRASINIITAIFSSLALFIHHTRCIIDLSAKGTTCTKVHLAAIVPFCSFLSN